MGVFWDNGKLTGNYYYIIIEGFNRGSYRGYTRLMEITWKLL